MKKCLERIQKKNKFLKNLLNKRMEKIQDLSKQADFSNSAYHYKDKNVSKIFVGFKGSLSFHKSIKEGYKRLEKAEEQQKEFKLELNEIVKVSKKSKLQNVL